ncbi:hypothetical protein KKP04_00775 [Rhodomicrobium sp. Az07]|uniref:hypothetical protein n=1 Tax=Rhodomicrobium sp. Az07 TaxID=2839034 RepID=UPI001BECD82F|nr:hypothetical protein [Rhodomicrobium sp. Az07]MBT3069404.1 hypothetical protein [Rhodomicrobium sp. Az07]
MRRSGKSLYPPIDSSAQELKHRLGTFTPDSLLFLAAGLLDHSADLLEEGEGRAAYELLERELSEVYDLATRMRCLSRLGLVVRSHRMYRHCSEEPSTSYAWKPGGYATSLDFLYGGIMPLGTPKSAAMLFEQLTGSTFALSVRLQKTLMRAYIEDVRTRRKRPRILALMPGHLRELEDGPLDLRSVDFSALDEQGTVCAFLSHKYRRQIEINATPLSRIEGSLRGRGGFDLIYAPLLLTITPDERARRLLCELKNQLVVGGRLVVGNVATTADLRGYLALFGRKRLLFRSRSDLKALVDGLKCEVYGDPFNNLNYLILEKGFVPVS